MPDNPKKHRFIIREVDGDVEIERDGVKEKKTKNVRVKFKTTNQTDILLVDVKAKKIKKGSVMIFDHYCPNCIEVEEYDD